MSEGKSHPKIRFGVFEFNPQARELSKHGSRLKLQEQPLQVLTALLEQAGEIVAREELQRRLWPDGTFVDFEQSLNKAINKLREALGDSAEKPIYVETVARRGYRFVAPVVVEAPRPAALEAAPEAAKEPPIPENRAVRSWARLWWGAGLASAILVTGLWPVPEPKVKITTLLSDERVQNGVLAIGRGRIIYHAKGLALGEAAGLWSVSTAGGEARRETTPCEEGTDTDMWDYSAVRQRLMVVCRPSISEFTYWLTDYDGGNPQWIGRRPMSDGAVWITPDLTTFAYPRKEGLFAEPVAGGQKRQLLRADVANVQMPLFWHPAGDRVGFLRKEGNLLKAWEVRTDGSGLRPLIPEFDGEQYAANWSPDGERLYFVSKQDIYLKRGWSWLGWMRQPLPVRLTSGNTNYGIPYEDPSNPLIVYAEGDIARTAAVKLNQKTNAWEPFLGGASVEYVTYASDGEWIAYVKWPEAELWKCRKDGSGKVMIENRLFVAHPRWSPDGSRIAFSGRERTTMGSRVAPWYLYTISANGGKAERVPGVPGSGAGPAWSPDGKRIAFWLDPEIAKDSREEPHISIVNLADSSVEVMPGSEGLFGAAWSPDGKWFVASASRWDGPKSFLYSFATRQWRPLRYVLASAGWSKDGRYLYGSVAWWPMLVRIEISTGKSDEIRNITEFKPTSLSGGETLPWAPEAVSWTPEGEPVTLKLTMLDQIYKIERDR